MTTQNSSNGPEGTIPVATAIELTANWRTYLASSDQSFIAQSFLVPIINLKNILEFNPDAQNVRVYLGLEDATDPATAKLIFVPVSNGQDIVYLPSENNGGSQDGNESKSNVFDFTTQCPPICPVKSLLSE